MPIPLPRPRPYTPPNPIPVVQYPQPPAPWSPAMARRKDRYVYEHMIDPAAYHPMPQNPWAYMAPERDYMDPIEGYDDVDAFMDLLDAELDDDEDLYGYMDLYGAEEGKERKRPFKKILSLFKRKEGEDKAPIDKVLEVAERVTAQTRAVPQAAVAAREAAAEEFERAAPQPAPSGAKKALVIAGASLGVVAVVGGSIWIGSKLAKSG